MAFFKFITTVVGGSAVATVMLAGAVKTLHVLQTKAAIKSIFR
jgi:hypothetical protein